MSEYDKICDKKKAGFGRLLIVLLFQVDSINTQVSEV